MFKSKTLFIVGAGASREVNLPTGQELKAKIASALDIGFQFGVGQQRGDRLIVEALKRHTRDPETKRSDVGPYVEAGWRIRDAMPQAISIDNFIDAHRGDAKIALMGKLAIVRCIIEAEGKRKIHFAWRSGKKLDWSNLTETWYSAFFQMAMESVAKDSVHIAFENVSFITFNYDRCIQHFLVQALLNYYGFDEPTAIALARSLSITHPYGKAGSLPWEGDPDAMEFGGPDHDWPDSLLALTKQIKTFTERVESEFIIESLRKRIEAAETIVFLGFAFHPLNLQLIAPSKPGKAKRIFGTTKGMSDSDRRSIEADLAEWLKRRRDHITIELRDQTCAGLFSEFRRTIPRA